MEWISRKTVLIVGLGLMGGSYAKGLKRLGFHVVAIDTDADAVCDFNHEDVVHIINVLNGAIETACGHDLLSALNGIAEVLDFLLFLLLRTNHEEVHDGEHNNKHDNHAHAPIALGGQ